MNIFKKELKYRFKGMAFLLIGLVFLVFASMTKYDSFAKSPEVINDVINKLPKIVKLIYGINGTDLTSLTGYYSIVHLYLVLIFGIFYSLLVINIFKDEKIDKTEDFLCTLPISRTKIIRQKLLFVVCNLIFILFLLFIITFLILKTFSFYMLLQLFIIIFISSLFYLSLAFFLYSYFKNTQAFIIGLIFFGYFLDIIIQINDQLKYLSFLSMFAIFNTEKIIKNNINYFSLFIVLIVSLCLLYYGLKKLKSIDV